MAPLRAVTFDCWQTLILDRPDGLARARAGRIQGIHDLVAAQGICVDRSAVERAYDAVGERLETVWKTQRDIGSRGQQAHTARQFFPMALHADFAEQA